MMKLIAILFTVALASSCASITTGQNQAVSIDTPNCPAVTCRLTNKDGVYFASGTPATVMVNRACGPLTIQCEKDGEPDYVMSVGSSVKAMAFGNILFGGLIGVGVDAATGAACEYPSMIPVPMSCGEPSSQTVQLKIPELVLQTAEELECATPEFMARAPEGVDVYSTKCAENHVFLSCDSEECSVSEYSLGGS